MQFALVECQRVSAQPNLVGTCPLCGEPVIAKCGPMRVWHWAHRRKLVCDHCWEPETHWHRGWKNHFPRDWQEVICRGLNGEKRIADVKTPHGLSIEFQHSSLKQNERVSREAFYSNMVWIVDGTRRKRDRKRFFDSLPCWRRLGKGVLLAPLEEGLPKEWLDKPVLVYFDFGDDRLWCLLPKRIDGRVVVVVAKRAAVIGGFRNGRVFDAEKLTAALEIMSPSCGAWHRVCG
jgi:hypothetical protein